MMMTRGILAALTVVTLAAHPANAAERPVTVDGDITATIGTIGCGANGKTVAHINLEATAGTQVAALNIVRSRSVGTRHVAVSDAERVVAKVRVAAGRPVSVVVVDGADVLTRFRFAGYSC